MIYVQDTEAFFLNRCKRFLTALKERGADAALISRFENMRWLTGYTGEGCLFVAEDTAVILTDFRYVEQVERQAPECTCVRTRNGVTPQQAVKELMQARGLTSLRLETNFMSHDEFLSWQEALEGVALEPLAGLPEQLRIVKDQDELDLIAQAGKIACDAFDYILGYAKPGMTEKQVQIALDYKMLELGSERNAFSTIAAAGVNGSLPHAIPSDYVIQPGDLITLDFGAQVNGYKSDMTRTFGFGKVSDELKDIYNTVLEAHLKVLDAIKPGASCRGLDSLAREIIDAKYPGAFGHSLGHGVGLYIHEWPRLSQTSDEILAPGHVVTDEPGIYVPGLGGVRIEDTVFVTETGYIDPITAPKQLIEL